MKLLGIPNFPVSVRSETEVLIVSVQDCSTVKTVSLIGWNNSWVSDAHLMGNHGELQPLKALPQPVGAWGSRRRRLPLPFTRSQLVPKLLTHGTHWGVSNFVTRVSARRPNINRKGLYKLIYVMMCSFIVSSILHIEGKHDDASIIVHLL